MHHQQEHEPAFGKLYQRLVAPAQEAFKLPLTADGKPQREEMQREEDSERQAGEPVHQGRHPENAVAMRQAPGGHHSTTAATARRPRSKSVAPNAMANMLARRSPSGDHSVSTLRTPIAA